jgi:predicted nucleic acid-binding protein
VGARPSLILVDTDVFVIDLRYPRDPLFEPNRRFLEALARAERGFTTLVNLLELCGILSFNLNPHQLGHLWAQFASRYHLTVLPTPDLEGSFPALALERVFPIICRRSSLGDALMVAMAQEFLPFADTLVSWDREHLSSVFPGRVLTPEQWNAAYGLPEVHG